MYKYVIKNRAAEELLSAPEKGRSASPTWSVFEELYVLKNVEKFHLVMIDPLEVGLSSQKF